MNLPFNMKVKTIAKAKAKHMKNAKLNEKQTNRTYILLVYVAKKPVILLLLMLIVTNPVLSELLSK